MVIQPIRWDSGALWILDQTLLPAEVREVRLATAEAVWEALHELRVRGAPAIGVCAAYGVVVAVEASRAQTGPEAVDVALRSADYYATARPTAINLFWALDRMRDVARARRNGAGRQAVLDALEAEARAIHEDDVRRCRAIGEQGAVLVADGMGILTHCNAGALATSSRGTAMAILYQAHEEGRRFKVFADETRPLFQGSRLTAWELREAGISCTVLCDNAAASVLESGSVHLVLVGADRIAANGDTANKIGTYGLALLAQAHDIPFYVAAPLSSFDRRLATGKEIPIETRARDEIARPFGKQLAPADVLVYNPAFDVTPARLIAGIVTEAGILRPPYGETIAAAFATEEARSST